MALSSKPSIVNFKSDVWLQNQEFGLQIRKSDFRRQTEHIRRVGERQLVVQAICWDKNKSILLYPTAVGAPVGGEQVARVVFSRHPHFEKGQMVVCGKGWRTFSLIDPTKDLVRKIECSESFPLAIYLGVLGHPGLMLYFSLFEVCEPDKGDVMVVNGNRGFEFAMLGQMAKIYGCKVIACVQGQELVDFARSVKFTTVNIKRLDAATVISNMAPKGIDIYVDFLGAKFTHSILRCLRPDTRTVILGDNATYRAQGVGDVSPSPYRFVSSVNMRVNTHSVFDYLPFFDKAIDEITDWINHDKIIYKVNAGGVNFDTLPQEFIMTTTINQRKQGYEKVNQNSNIHRSTNYRSPGLPKTLVNTAPRLLSRAQMSKKNI